MRAILIDPIERKVTEVDHDGNYKQIYKLIGCQTFTAVYIGDPPEEIPSDPRRNAIFIDDEGLLNNPRYFFIWRGYPQPLAGKGLILGANEEGDSCSTNWTVEQATAMVQYKELSVQGFKTEEGTTDFFGHKAAMIRTTPIFGPPTTEDDNG
jgi:hypothetical protein